MKHVQISVLFMSKCNSINKIRINKIRIQYNYKNENENNFRKVNKKYEKSGTWLFKFGSNGSII